MQESWTNVGVFWTTVLVAIVTAAATALNYFLYRAHVDPEVVVFVEADERRPTIINLVIQNIGKSVAKRVRFELSEPLPSKAVDGRPVAPQMTEGPIIHGIPALGPGVRRTITWGQYGGLSKALGDRIITLTARYSGDARTPWDPSEFITESLLDVKSLETTDVSDHNYDKVAAQQLKTIASAVEKMSRGWSVLRVEVQNPPGDPEESPGEGAA